MKTNLKPVCAWAAVLLLLQGCGTVAAKDPEKFPAIDSAWQKEGTFPNLDNLRQIAPGVSKDQLYELVGRPHFSEGLGAGEWNYIFKFRTGKGSDSVSCQYKVVFDDKALGRDFHWAPSACADRLKAEAPGERIVERVVERVVWPTDERVERPPVDAAPPAKIHQLSGDVLFAFDRSGPNDLLPKGLAELDRIAKDLAAAKPRRMDVIGFTDRLGSGHYNQALSEARAATVREYLVSKGIPAERISASGRGMSSPIVECTQQSLKALVECLAPNRRVEIVVSGR
jgi:OmpA-OmpF porin, OOP family